MSTILVIGGGPAGLEAAQRAGQAGHAVTLVSQTPAGGRATMGSLLPSKVWLHAASRHGQSDAPDVVRHIHATRAQWIERNDAALAEAGVVVVRGRAVLTSRTSVDVFSGDEANPSRTLRADAIIIASGSEPRFAPGVRPNGERIIAPRHTQALEVIPEHIVFAGGGVTTTEYASAFAALGARVEICTRGSRLLSRGEKEVAEAITHHLESEHGITIHRNSVVTAVEQVGDVVRTHTADGAVIESSHAFIATGRDADLSTVEAGPAELASQFQRNADGSLWTDEHGMTNIEGVYAIGDAAGGTFTVAKAVYEARVVVRAIGGTAGSKERRPDILEAVYSNPEVAWVGPFESLPDRSDDDYELVRRPFTSLLASHIHGTAYGFAKLWVRRRDGVVVAGAAFGEQAATVCTVIQLACNTGLTLEQLSSVPGAHPTIVELFGI